MLLSEQGRYLTDALEHSSNSAAIGATMRKSTAAIKHSSTITAAFSACISLMLLSIARIQGAEIAQL